MWFVVVMGLWSSQLIPLEGFEAIDRPSCYAVAAQVRETLPTKLFVFCLGPDGEI